MRSDRIDWRGGEVRYWSLDVVDLDHPLALQVDDLGEDLAQVHYSPSTALDVGWYPTNDATGCFRIVVIVARTGDDICAGDWERPVFTSETGIGPVLPVLLADAAQIASIWQDAQRAARTGESSSRVPLPSVAHELAWRHAYKTTIQILAGDD